MVIRYILTAVIAYLLGSVSTGILVAKVTGKADPRTVGSKSTGMTNSLRTMGAKSGIIVLIGDAVKALLACLAGWLLVDQFAAEPFPPYGRMLAAVFVIIGHIWPCYFSFKGGKGVVCIMASMLTCFPIPALVCIAIGLLMVVFTRMVSVGSIVGVALYAICSLFWFGQGNWIVMAFAWVVAILCIFKHRTNIVRIMHGEENKFSVKK